MSDTETRLRSLLAAARDRISELEEENRQLLALAMGEWVELPIHVNGVTAKQKQMLRILLSRSPKVVTNRYFAELLWQDGDSERQYGNLKVQICKLRSALAGTGIEIKTEWGEGYSIPAASAEILRGLA